MVGSKTGRGSEQFVVRMPDGMRDQLSEIAKANGRSMNAEIVAALETWLKRDSISLDPAQMSRDTAYGLGQAMARALLENPTFVKEFLKSQGLV